jgi:TldD protein
MKRTIDRRGFLRWVGAGAAAVTLPALHSRLPQSALLGIAQAKDGTGNYFARFGITETILRRTMDSALSHGGDFCDIYLEHTIDHTVGLQDGQIDRAYGNVDLGAGIRVLKGEATGYAYSEDLSEAALRSAAETAAAVADGTPQAAPASLAAVPIGDYYTVALPWDQVQIDRKLPILEKAEAWTRKGESRIVRVSVYMSDSDSRILLANSEGLIVEDHRPHTLLWLIAVGKDGDRVETSSQSIAARSGFEFYTEDRMRKMTDLTLDGLRRMFEAVSIPGGELPVVLAGGTSGILLHEAIGHGMEADANRKGTSIYSDRMNTRIASEEVTIVDDATIPFAEGALNVDDEGVPGQKTVLVENGILRSYMHDRLSARHYKVAQTGSGRRQSFRNLPIPRMRCTYMLPGKHDPQEIIASVKKGIYAEDFTNGEVRIGAGDFTFFLKIGALIEDGKLTRPIKDVNIVGNGPKVLEKMDMIGTDFGLHPGSWACGKEGQSVPVSQGLPTVRAGVLSVGGRGA